MNDAASRNTNEAAHQTGHEFDLKQKAGGHGRRITGEMLDGFQRDSFVSKAPPPLPYLHYLQPQTRAAYI